MRAENCNLCADDLCEDCVGMTFEDGCNTCVENGVFNEDGACECIEDHIYNAEDHLCKMTCHPDCDTCTDIDIFSCSECSVGYYLQPDTTICLPSCPSGSTPVGTICELIPEYKACITFDHVRYTRDATGDEAITSKGGDTAGPDKESNDPMPIYLRGNWYDGVDDYTEIMGLHVHLNFTIEMWIRPAGPGTLFSINRNIHSSINDEDFIRLSYAGLENIKLLVASGDADRVDLSSSSTGIQYNDWHSVAFTISWDGLSTSNIVLYADGVQIKQDTAGYPLIDKAVY